MIQDLYGLEEGTLSSTKSKRCYALGDAALGGIFMNLQLKDARRRLYDELPANWFSGVADALWTFS